MNSGIPGRFQASVAQFVYTHWGRAKHEETKRRERFMSEFGHLGQIPSIRGAIRLQPLGQGETWGKQEAGKVYE